MRGAGFAPGTIVRGLSRKGFSHLGAWAVTAEVRIASPECAAPRREDNKLSATSA